MKSNETILKLINKNASVNEICSITGLTQKQLFYRMNMLKIKGYDFEKKFYYNGDIVYSIINSLKEENKNEKTIITSPKDTEFRAVLISDLHLGNIKDRPDLLYEVYNFCVKEGINIIINAGDLIDGAVGCGNNHNKKISDVNHQLEYLLKNYPYDKNVLNFICLGNHDYSCLSSTGIDLEKILDNKRHDLISLGYGFGRLNVKNEQIIVTHPSTANVKMEPTNCNLILTGHSHKSKNIYANANTHIYIPSLSEVDVFDTNGLHAEFPGMLKVTFPYKNGYFYVGKFEHFLFINNKMYKVSESQENLISGKKYQNAFVNNEENRKSLSMDELEKIAKKDDVKKLERKITSDMSQIEKFKARYGK